MCMVQEHDEAEEEAVPSLEARFEEYCNRVENSADWGGQLELRALAQALQRSITVYSVGMPPVVMGSEAQQGVLGSTHSRPQQSADPPRSLLLAACLAGGRLERAVGMLAAVQGMPLETPTCSCAT